jgi:F-box/WD-40 domain protein 7
MPPKRVAQGPSLSASLSKGVKVGGVAKKPRTTAALLDDLEEEASLAELARKAEQERLAKEEALRAQARANLLRTFTCPISLSLMIDPVVMADGHSYERKEAQKHLRTTMKSPVTGKRMENVPVRDNETLRIAIATAVETGDIDGELVDEYKENVAQRERDRKALDVLKDRMYNKQEAAAYVEMGDAHYHGLLGLEPCEPAARLYYKDAADLGHPTGAAMYGVIAVEANGVLDSVSKGIAYLGIAAERGSELGRLYLGRLNEEGAFGFKLDHQEAERWYKMAASASVRDGTDERHAQAKAFLEKAAEEERRRRLAMGEDGSSSEDEVEVVDEE